MTTQPLDPLGSRIVDACQNCGSTPLRAALFLGYVPPVNSMLDIGTPADAEMRFPLALFRCDACTLVQIGYEVEVFRK